MYMLFDQVHDDDETLVNHREILLEQIQKASPV